MFERREAIRKFIDAKGEVSIGELASHFPSWSEMTLRRDLAALVIEAAEEAEVYSEKELSTEEQVALSEQLGLTVNTADLLSPKTFHARTAAALIPYLLPQFADPVICEAVRWHTTGHRGMTLTEKLLYLADYIDESRTFENCVTLRRRFWDADPARMDQVTREVHLRDILILSYDMTVRDLLDEGAPVAEDTVLARNELLLERAGL